jgi:hypothetical protein
MDAGRRRHITFMDRDEFLNQSALILLDLRMVEPNPKIGDDDITFLIIRPYASEPSPTRPFLDCTPGVPGNFCTRGNETNWYGRSLEWHEESGIQLSRS